MFNGQKVKYKESHKWIEKEARKEEKMRGEERRATGVNHVRLIGRQSAPSSTELTNLY